MPDETAGPATDRYNEPVVDPTPNVLREVNLSNRRQDDLRWASEERLREMVELRASHAAEILELRARLGEKSEECVKEMAELRADQADKLAMKETERLDAIRRVDVEASQRDKEVQTAKADALAKNVEESAAVMRGQVESAAIAAAESLRQALIPLNTTMESLRQSQQRGEGQKEQVGESQRAGANTWIIIGGIVGLAVILLMLVGLAVTIYFAGQGMR